MKKISLPTILVLVLGVLLMQAQPVLAVPPLPSGFYGTVKLNGANVPAGTVVSAKVNGVQYASIVAFTYQGDTVYSLDVPGDDNDSPGTVEGGVAGNTVVFYIGDIQATQTAPWQTGTNVALNLTGANNHAPLITEGAAVSVTMSENGSFKPFDLTLHATDADENTITWSILSGAGHGTAAASGTGVSKVISYTPIANYVGADSFVVQVSDGSGGTATVTVNVTIKAYSLLPLILR